MPATADPVPHPCHGEAHGNQDNVLGQQVPRVPGIADQRELARVAEDGLGDERRFGADLKCRGRATGSENPGPRRASVKS